VAETSRNLLSKCFRMSQQPVLTELPLFLFYFFGRFLHIVIVCSGMGTSKQMW